jgi:hypothetical protein
MTTTISGSYPAVNSDSDATVNGLTVGRGAGAVASNTAVGASALNANTTGTGNVAVGQNSLLSNTTANYNNAFGAASLYSNTTGANNVAMGDASLYANTTGANNTSIGATALRFNTTASFNTAVGTQAAYSNTTGSQLTAIGRVALYSNTTGTEHTAVGHGALYANTTGNYNTAFSSGALGANTTGSNNVAIGYSALQANTTGTESTAVGYQAAWSNTTGFITALGYRAGYASNGNAVVYVGYNAGVSATGSSNTFIGSSAGESVTSGAGNTIVGRFNGNQGGLDIRTVSDNIVLSDGGGNPRYYFDAASGDWFLNQVTAGYFCLMRYKNQAGAYFSVGTQSGASPNFQIYNPSGGGVYLGYSASSWTGVSDERLKNITGEISNGLNKVNQLRAVEFTWKRDATNESQVGLIAQDVQKVLPQAIGEDGDGNLGVRYTEVIPLLVAAIKELKAEVDSLKQQLGN